MNFKLFYILWILCCGIIFFGCMYYDNKPETIELYHSNWTEWEIVKEYK